jgi:hypothetical protein
MVLGSIVAQAECNIGNRRFKPMKKETKKKEKFDSNDLHFAQHDPKLDEIEGDFLIEKLMLDR